jgi:hypothetical protein
MYSIEAKSLNQFPLLPNKAILPASRKSKSFLIALAIALGLFAAPRLQAQGCIVARSPEQILPGIDQNGLPTGQGGFLQPGHFQLTIGERHQFSYQHFVGDVYQEYRAQLHNQVENRINLVTADLMYQWTPRISFEINAPFLFASRKTQNSPIKYEAQCIGDTILAEPLGFESEKAVSRQRIGRHRRAAAHRQRRSAEHGEYQHHRHRSRSRGDRSGRLLHPARQRRIRYGPVMAGLSRGRQQPHLLH